MVLGTHKYIVGILPWENQLGSFEDGLYWVLPNIAIYATVPPFERLAKKLHKNGMHNHKALAGCT